MNRPILGQHFLRNKTAVTKIITKLELKKSDEVIEIGPGKGFLTIPLNEVCEKIGCTLSGIEKDAFLKNELQKQIPSLKIHEGDVLKILPNLITTNKKYKLVGNIPYYLTGKLLRIIGELKQKPECTVFTIQKEVAERLAATPPKMNLLAAATQVWGVPQILMTLKPSDFSPQPKIYSSIIKLIPASHIKNTAELEHYYRFIKIIFKQPRKTIFNNLRSGLEVSEKKLIELLAVHKIDPQARPQDLELSLLIKLAKSLHLNML